MRIVTRHRFILVLMTFKSDKLLAVVQYKATNANNRRQALDNGSKT